MAVVYEEFIRCACGSADFKEEVVLTFNKSILARDSKAQELVPMDKEYRYSCAQCNSEINR